MSKKAIEKLTPDDAGRLFVESIDCNNPNEISRNLDKVAKFLVDAHQEKDEELLIDKMIEYEKQRRQEESDKILSLCPNLEIYYVSEKTTKVYPDEEEIINS